MDDGRSTPQSRAWSQWYWLLFVIPIASLWVPFYNRVEPTILGFPFFYAFQLIWVVVSAIITACVYIATRAPLQR
jgi:hypothetical protein